MSAIEALLAVYSARDGVGYRFGNFRHRRLDDAPIALVVFQLGGEPFSVAALAYGRSTARYDLVVPGQPLDRTQLFASLLPVARWFNKQFELPWGLRKAVTVGTRNPRTVIRAPHAPQVIVTNTGTVKLLGKLGRRLAYLPTEATPSGPPPAPHELVRFGRHLQFLARQHREPGQQLVVDMTTLLTDSWVTAQTVMERAKLAAMDAWVTAPPGGGFKAAIVAEQVSAGPTPSPDVERDIADRMEQLNEARKANDGPAEKQARLAITAMYRDLVDPAWALLWRVRDREAGWPEEPRYTPRRVLDDVEQYSNHMSWMDGPVGGRRRTRDSVRAAIFARRRSETAVSLVAAEEACSDPVRMIGYLLDHKAVEGKVDPFDFEHKEVKPGNKRATNVPRIRLTTAWPSMVPVGKELWWTEEPAKVRVIVESVTPDRRGPGSILILKVLDGVSAAQPLRTAPTACFSILSTQTFGGYLPVADSDPFTHIPNQPDPGTEHIEPEGDTRPPGGVTA
jgi:hypothetical protein